MSDAKMAGEALALLKRAYPHAKYYLTFSTPEELVVATILSAQCRDEVVNACTARLFKRYKTPRDFAAAPLPELEKGMSSITFFRNKAKAIKEACRIIAEKHHGKVPQDMKALTELPGIGRKTANAILQNAFDKVEGVIVDTHVIRLSQRLGFTKQKDPEKIEKDLMELFPKTDWKRLPWLMKEHGRAVCTAPVPKCRQCVLFRLCPKVGVAKSVYT